MTNRLPILLVILASCTTGPVPVIRQQAIVGGTTDRSDPAVAEVLIEDARGQIWAVCTGTLISARVVMTAAHCVSIDDPELPPVSPKQVFFGTVLKEPTGKVINVVKTAVHPAYNGARIEDGGDIALLLLAEPPGIAPAPINRTKLEGHQGEQVRLVGFGITAGDARDDGTKRQVTTTLDEVAPKLILLRSSNQNTCHGDSGGPTFMRVGGQEVVVGVTSYGDELCEQYGANTRVDIYAGSFVDPWLAANDASPTTSDHCEADGICGTSCAQPDPDCKQSPTDPDPTCEGNDCVHELTGEDPYIEGGCAVARRGSPASFLLLALGALLLRRRR